MASTEQAKFPVKSQKISGSQGIFGVARERPTLREVFTGSTAGIFNL
jgi:hypothetical protein